VRSRDGAARASAPQCASARAAPTATQTSVAAWWRRRSVIQSIAFTQLSKSEKGGLTWHSLGGKDLEPALLSGAIRLLDIAWLVDLAARGCVLSRRQACCREGRAGLLGSRPRPEHATRDAAGAPARGFRKCRPAEIRDAHPG